MEEHTSGSKNRFVKIRFIIYVISHRELTMMYGPQLCASIDDYKLVEMLVHEVYSKERNSMHYLRNLNAETLRLVVEFAFPGLGPLVPSFVEKRNISTHIERLFSNTVKDTNIFRICLRKRPLFSYEQEQGTIHERKYIRRALLYQIGLYDVCRTDTAHTVTLHEGKLARNGRQLSMTHRQYVLDHGT